MLSFAISSSFPFALYIIFIDDCSFPLSTVELYLICVFSTSDYCLLFSFLLMTLIIVIYVHIACISCNFSFMWFWILYADVLLNIRVIYVNVTAVLYVLFLPLLIIHYALCWLSLMPSDLSLWILLLISFMLTSIWFYLILHLFACE